MCVCVCVCGVKPDVYVCVCVGCEATGRAAETKGRQRNARGIQPSPLAVHNAPRLPRKSHRQSGGDQGTPEDAFDVCVCVGVSDVSVRVGECVCLCAMNV